MPIKQSPTPMKSQINSSLPVFFPEEGEGHMHRGKRQERETDG